MADYIEITDEEIQPGAPYTTGLAAKMRDNWIAGFEAAAGAPRMNGDAIGEVVASTSDDDIILENPRVIDGENTSPSANTIHAVINIGQSGTVNVFCELRKTTNNAGSAIANLYINGVSVASLATGAGVGVWASDNETIEVNKGDSIAVSVGANTSNGPQMRNLRVRATQAAAPWGIS